MTKLQKDAWVNLIGIIVCLVIALPCFYILKQRDTQGLDYVIISIIVGGPTFLICILYWKKTEAGFDEREKIIQRRAYIWSTYVMTIYALLLCLIPFFIVGGGGAIPVFYLPVSFVIGLFIGQLTQSSIILVLSQQEGPDGV
jgi:RsiW-degrading membrane proteinase PrsW (M82 family)